MNDRRYGQTLPFGVALQNALYFLHRLGWRDYSESLDLALAVSRGGVHLLLLPHHERH